MFVRDGKLSCVEIKSGTKFDSDDVSAFNQLSNTNWEKGEKVIVCTLDKMSSISEDVFLIPISSI